MTRMNILEGRNHVKGGNSVLEIAVQNEQYNYQHGRSGILYPGVRVQKNDALGIYSHKGHIQYHTVK